MLPVTSRIHEGVTAFDTTLSRVMLGEMQKTQASSFSLLWEFMSVTLLAELSSIHQSIADVKCKGTLPEHSDVETIRKFIQMSKLLLDLLEKITY